MRMNLLKWLVCPIPACKGPLNLVVSEWGDAKGNSRSAESQSDTEDTAAVISGVLTCSSCGVYYPIHNGVPRMLTYPCKVTEIHAIKNAAWLQKHCREFSLPNCQCPPGEDKVLRNFSSEWLGYKWTGDSYWDTSPENLLRCMRYVLGIPRHSFKKQLALDVGAGIGGIADALSRSEDCEIIGMDLSYAIDQAYHYFGSNTRLHLVQASAFSPPFRDRTFDIVYSQGVLHHTYSTQRAFQNIALLPREGGMLSVWVYSHEQERRTTLRRMMMAFEKAVRPTLSNLPSSIQTICLLPVLPLYMIHQNVYRRIRSGREEIALYGWNESLHAARDRLTPPFAARHSYEEVAAWFTNAGYRNLEYLRDEPKPESVPEAYSLNVGVRGLRC